jgi:hypothetical protein
VLGEAYRLKEAFYEIYDAATPGEAMRRYEAWYRSITPENREPYSDLIRAWSNWQPYILNHFDHNITSGYVECLNSLIRVMNRLGRGYSFEALRAKILFTEGSHKHKLSRPKFERKRETEPAYKVAQEVVGYGVPCDPLPKAFDPHKHAGKPKNYGADINTLIALLEAGKL